MVKLINYGPSIDGLQGCNLQFHCFQTFIGKFVSCGLKPIRIVSFASC